MGQAANARGTGPAVRVDLDSHHAAASAKKCRPRQGREPTPTAFISPAWPCSWKLPPTRSWSAFSRCLREKRLNLLLDFSALAVGALNPFFAVLADRHCEGETLATFFAKIFVKRHRNPSLQFLWRRNRNIIMRRSPFSTSGGSRLRQNRKSAEYMHAAVPPRPTSSPKGIAGGEPSG